MSVAMVAVPFTSPLGLLFRGHRPHQFHSQLGSCQLTPERQTGSFRDPWQKDDGIITKGWEQGYWSQGSSRLLSVTGSSGGSSRPGPLLEAPIAKGWQHGAIKVDAPLGGWSTTDPQLGHT